jgi:hypothetical protein
MGQYRSLKECSVSGSFLKAKADNVEENPCIVRGQGRCNLVLPLLCVL